MPAARHYFQSISLDLTPAVASAECRNPANTALLAVELLRDEVHECCADLVGIAASCASGGGAADTRMSSASLPSGKHLVDASTCRVLLEYGATIQDALTQQIQVFNDGACLLPAPYPIIFHHAAASG